MQSRIEASRLSPRTTTLAMMLVCVSASASYSCAAPTDESIEPVGATEDALRFSSSKVRADLQCVWNHDDETFEAVFAYENRANETLRIDHGKANSLRVFGDGGAAANDGEQPSMFLAGHHSDVVTIRAPRRSLVAWQLGGRVELAHAWSPRCGSPPVTGRALFSTATFGGNGRTCRTCHSEKTGTLTPADVASRPEADPLFRWDGLDDFASGTDRIRRDATILVRVPLPPNVRLANDRAATSVVVRRGVPSTLNVPALDPVLMQDGRASDLMNQAHGAIMDHAQAPAPATPADLQRIADFQRTEKFFSSPLLADAFFFGRGPTLPEGTSDAERRGRAFFVDQPLGPNLEGVCALCHSGPMLNQTNQFLSAINPGLVAGLRFIDIGVTDVNLGGHPVQEFVVTAPDGTESTLASPDPGRLLISGRPIQANSFKIPTLWGSRSTAPYFHDNSAKNLDDVFDQYDRYFMLFLGKTLTEQQRVDITAYLDLLR
jgi:hypothetical protein